MPSLVSKLIPIVTRILTVKDFGIYALGIVYTTFISGIANFGLTIGYERNFFENKESMEKQGALLFSVLSFVVINFFIGINNLFTIVQFIILDN